MFGGILMVLMFLVALFLILLVLIQRGRGGGLAGAFGGMGGQSAFGTKAGDLFTQDHDRGRGGLDPAVRVGRQVLQHRRFVQQHAGRCRKSDDRRALPRPRAPAAVRQPHAAGGSPRRTADSPAAPNRPSSCRRHAVETLTACTILRPPSAEATE